MKEIQTRLAKIRSDAAECRLLSNLVTDEKREVFARTAEHLIDLALEVEKTIATNSVDIARAGAREEAVATEIAAAHHQGARPRRMLTWLLVVVLGAIVGAFFWANNPAKEYWFHLAVKTRDVASTTGRNKAGYSHSSIRRASGAENIVGTAKRACRAC